MASRQPTISPRAVAPLDPTCPQCGADGITTTQVDHAFRYGSGNSAANLKVKVPARRCGACDFEFLDDEAERIKHQAVCGHLGVLLPADIRRIRKRHGMTRRSFARVTGLGEATLSRWENGILVQNLANDRYMRLLERTEIMQTLNGFLSHEQTAYDPADTSTNRFRMLTISAEVRQAQAGFQLRQAS